MHTPVQNQTFFLAQTLFYYLCTPLCIAYPVMSLVQCCMGLRPLIQCFSNTELMTWRMGHAQGCKKIFENFKWKLGGLNKLRFQWNFNRLLFSLNTTTKQKVCEIRAKKGLQPHLNTVKDAPICTRSFNLGNNPLFTFIY